MFFSAGILLYKVIAPDKVLFLLGKDTKYKLWSDFGGRSEEIDRGIPVNTASREFYEESMGCISDISELRFHLQNAMRLDCVSYKNRKYYMYLLNANRILSEHQMNDMLTRFYHQQAMLNQIHCECIKKFKEKQDMCWLPLKYVTDNPILFREVFYNSVVNNLDKIRKCVIA